jgi:hypothetical protein
MMYQEGSVFTLLSCRTCFGTPYAELYNIAPGLPREMLKQVQDDKLFYVFTSTPENGHYQKYFCRRHTF